MIEAGEDGFFLQSVKRLRLARVQLSRTWTPGAKKSGVTSGSIRRYRMSCRDARRSCTEKRYRRIAHAVRHGGALLFFYGLVSYRL